MPEKFGGAAADGLDPPMAVGDDDAVRQVLDDGVELFPLGQHRAVILDLEEVLDAGQEFAAVERLGDEIVGPGLQAPDAVLRFLQGGDHDDRDDGGGLVGPEAAADLVAVDLRQHDVEEDQVRMLRAATLARASSPSYGGDGLDSPRPGGSSPGASRWRDSRRR